MGAIKELKTQEIITRNENCWGETQQNKAQEIITRNENCWGETQQNKAQEHFHTIPHLRMRKLRLHIVSIQPSLTFALIHWWVHSARDTHEQVCDVNAQDSRYREWAIAENTAPYRTRRAHSIPKTATTADHSHDTTCGNVIRHTTNWIDQDSVAFWSITYDTDGVRNTETTTSISFMKSGQLIYKFTVIQRNRAQNKNFLESRSNHKLIAWTTLPCYPHCWEVNPFTPKSDQFQISPAVSPELEHHTEWRTWLSIAYSDERWLRYQFSLLHLCVSFGKWWENNLSEL